jgi:hypothetical protein
MEIDFFIVLSFYKTEYRVYIGRIPAFGGDRAIRLYLLPNIRDRAKGYRFYPLRVLVIGRPDSKTRNSAYKLSRVFGETIHLENTSF